MQKTWSITDFWSSDSKNLAIPTFMMFSEPKDGGRFSNVPVVAGCPPGQLFSAFRPFDFFLMISFYKSRTKQTNFFDEGAGPQLSLHIRWQDDAFRMQVEVILAWESSSTMVSSVLHFSMVPSVVSIG